MNIDVALLFFLYHIDEILMFGAKKRTTSQITREHIMKMPIKDRVELFNFKLDDSKKPEISLTIQACRFFKPQVSPSEPALSILEFLTSCPKKP